MMQAENSKRSRVNSDEEDFAGFDEAALGIITLYIMITTNIFDKF